MRAVPRFCVAAIHRGCEHQLGKQAEADNRSGPHSTFLPLPCWGTQQPTNSHTHGDTCKHESKPAEVQGRQHLTKLLHFDYVSYFTAKLRTAVWMSLWEKKTTTWYLTHFVWGEFRQVCFQQCEEWFGAVRSRCWQTSLNAEQTFWIHAVQAWLGSAGRLSTGCPAGCVVSAFIRGW